MGLTYPLDIDAWAAWQKRQNTLRWAKGEARSLIGRLRGVRRRGCREHRQQGLPVPPRPRADVR